MVLPTHGTPFPFRPLHARLVRCWPACVWSVYGCVVVSAAVWLVHGGVSRLMVGLFVVGSFLLLPALSRPALWCRRRALSWVRCAKARVRAARYGESLWYRSCHARHVRCRVPCAATGVWLARCVGSHAFGLSLLPVLVLPAMRSSCMGVWLSCCCQRYAWPILLPWRCLRRLIAGMCCCRVCWAMVAIGGRLRLCGGARTPPWWAVLCWYVAHPMVGSIVVACGPPHGGPCCGGVWPPSWWGLVWWCVAPLMVGRGVVVSDPPHGGACCFGVWPPSWWGTLRWCVGPLMVGHAVVVFGPPHGGAWCVGVWPPSWWGVPSWCVPPHGVAWCGRVWHSFWWGVLR